MADECRRSTDCTCSLCADTYLTVQEILASSRASTQPEDLQRSTLSVPAAHDEAMASEANTDANDNDSNNEFEFELEFDAALIKTSNTNWRVRKEGFKQIKALLELPGVTANQVQPALQLFDKMCADVNASCMETGIAAVLAYVKHIKPIESSMVTSVMECVTDKGFSSRSGIAALSKQLTDAFIVAGAADITTKMLLQGAKKRKLKAPSVCLMCILEALKAYGPKVVSVEHIMNELPELFKSSTSDVRSLAMNILVEVHRLMGPAFVKVAVDNLRQTQKMEFEELTKDAASDQPIPAKLVRSTEQSGVGIRARRESAGVIGNEEGEEEKTSPGFLFDRADGRRFFTKDLLADMQNVTGKAAWKKRSAAMDTVQSICESAGCKMQLTRSVEEVLHGLKARLTDSNANLKVKAANVIGVVASSVGPEIGKVPKSIGASLIRGVADNKKLMRVAAIQALDRWVCHNNETSSVCMERLLPALSEGLLKLVGRVELLDWAAKHLRNCSALNLYCLTGPTVQCMMDRSAAARKKAQQLMVEVVKSVGKKTVLRHCRDIKPAAMRALKPLLQKVFGAMDGSAVSLNSPASAAPTVPSVMSSHPPPSISQQGSVGSTNSTIAREDNRERLSGSHSLIAAYDVTPSISRSGEEPKNDPPSSSSTGVRDNGAEPLLKRTTNKRARLAKGQRSRWIVDTSSKREIDARKSELQAEWKPFLSSELHDKLFASTLDCGMMAAMDDVMVCVLQQPEEVVSSLDLVLKWCTLRIVDNNVKGLVKLLELLVGLFEMLKSVGYELHDVEADILLPCLLQKSGQSQTRFRDGFRDVMMLVLDVYNWEKYIPYLRDCFNGARNIKSRCECMNLVKYMAMVKGYRVLGRQCVKDVAKHLAAREKELRESAIEVLITVYTQTDDWDVNKFCRFADVTSQRGVDLLNARVERFPDSSFQLEAAAPAALEETSQPEPHQQLSGPDGLRPAALLAPPFSTLQHGQTDTSVPIPPDLIPMFDQVQNGTTGDGAGGNDYEAGGGEYEDKTEVPVRYRIEELLGPIRALITQSLEIVPVGSSAHWDGVNALEVLYVFAHRRSDVSKVEVMNSYVNEILLTLCDCIHCSFAAEDTEKRLDTHVARLALTVLGAVLDSEAVNHIQSCTAAGLLLELCWKSMDPRLEKSSALANTLGLASMSLAEKQFWTVSKELRKAVDSLTQKVDASVVYPAILHLLEWLVTNDVPVYHKGDLVSEDTLDQRVGRLLLELSGVQAGKLIPFEHINISSVLMQMDSFFSSQSTQHVNIATESANDTVQVALAIITESLSKTQLASLLEDLPATSHVRMLLKTMTSFRSAQAFVASRGVRERSRQRRPRPRRCDDDEGRL